MPAELSALLFVFLLATFIGLGVVTRVSRLLHTPLMSLTTAIALAASMTNIVSGFLITDRMLRLFKKPGDDKKP
ncbi:MAG: proton-translocating transhydrogenase family protein [Burkholderiales bacterium]